MELKYFNHLIPKELKEKLNSATALSKQGVENQAEREPSNEEEGTPISSYVEEVYELGLEDNVGIIVKDCPEMQALLVSKATVYLELDTNVYRVADFDEKIEGGSFDLTELKALSKKINAIIGSLEKLS